MEDSVREYIEYLHAQGNIDDILGYSEATMKKENVVQQAGIS